MENVAVIGASVNPDRYSYKAMKMLEEKGHCPIPVAPAKDMILDRKAYPSLAEVPEHIETVTMYVGVSRQDDVIEDALRIKPRRIIFNPGAENPGVYLRLKEAGIVVVEACTLILLSTDQF
jgi:hypothetical protein